MQGEVHFVKIRLAGRRGEENKLNKIKFLFNLGESETGEGGYFESYFDKEKFTLLSHFLRLRGELLFVNLIVS